VCYELGEFYFSEDNFEKALDFFNKAFKSACSNNDKADVIKMIITCYVFLDQYENALLHSKIGLSFKDDLFFHCNIIACTKNLVEARLYAEKVLKNFPNSVDLHYHYAIILRDNGDYEKAWQELLECFKYDPKFEPAKIVIEELNRVLYGNKPVNS